MMFVRDILNCVIVCSSVVYGQSGLYIEDESLKNKTCSGNDVIFTVSATNTIKCAALCDIDHFCSGFIFHSSDSKCVACQGGDGNLILAGVGTKYFRPQHAKWGHECDDIRTCSGTNQQCLDDVCVCTPGYSFNASSRVCQAGCAVYGNTFQRYRGHRILYNNFDYRYNIDLSRCLGTCINHLNPVCVSVDFRLGSDTTGTCNLQTVTALDKPSDYEEMTEYDYYNRNC